MRAFSSCESGPSGVQLDPDMTARTVSARIGSVSLQQRPLRFIFFSSFTKPGVAVIESEPEFLP